MVLTSTPFGPDFVKEFISLLLKTFEEATAHAYRIIWDVGIQVVHQHLIVTGLILFAILISSAVDAFLTGRWGWFASVLYNYLYGGVMIIIGFIWGPEVFANDYFRIVAVIVYIVCFLLVGKVLKETGLHRRF